MSSAILTRRWPTSEPLRAAAASIRTGVLLQAIVACSGILAARLLGVDDRGRLALLWIIALVVGQLATVGTHAAVAYEIANGRSPRVVLGSLRRILPTMMAAAASVQVVALLLLVDLGTTGQRAAAAATVVAPPVLILFLMGLAVAQGRQDYRRLQRHRLLQSLAYTAGLVALAISGEGSLAFVAALWAATLLAFGLYAWRDCVGFWWPAAPEPGARPGPSDLLRFGLRALFGAFGATEHLMLDQLLVGVLLPPRELGYFVAAIAFANLPRFVGQSIGYVAFPRVGAARTAGDRSHEVRRCLAIAAGVLIPLVGVLFVVVGVLLPLAFGEAFAAAVPAARLLLVAALFHGLRRVLTEASRGYGSGAPGAAAEGAFVVTLLAAGGALAPHGGTTGAATAVLIASAVGLVSLVVLLRRGSWRPPGADPVPLVVAEVP